MARSGMEGGLQTGSRKGGGVRVWCIFSAPGLNDRPTNDDGGQALA